MYFFALLHDIVQYQAFKHLGTKDSLSCLFYNFYLTLLLDGGVGHKLGLKI